MIDSTWASRAEYYLETLCAVTPNRRTGSPGNREATRFFAQTVGAWGYDLDTTEFPCLDFESDGASLVCEDDRFDVRVSPFSLGCDVSAELVTASTSEELEHLACSGKILLMKGPLCAEQLMPKNFVFYNPDHHKRIYALLEEKQPAAIVTATAKNPALVGAICPFPMIEDGDFDIPSAYCTEDTGEQIAGMAGEVCHMIVRARRIPSSASNVIARKRSDAPARIAVTAHIDA